MITHTHSKAILRFLTWQTIFFVFLILFGFAGSSRASIPNLDYKFAYHPEPITAGLKHKVQQAPIFAFSRKSYLIDFSDEDSFNESVKEIANKMNFELTPSSRVGLFLKGRARVGINVRF